jgi:hypothetical protein
VRRSLGIIRARSDLPRSPRSPFARRPRPRRRLASFFRSQRLRPAIPIGRPATASNRTCGRRRSSLTWRESRTAVAGRICFGSCPVPEMRPHRRSIFASVESAVATQTKGCLVVVGGGELLHRGWRAGEPEHGLLFRHPPRRGGQNLLVTGRAYHRTALLD